MKEKQIWQKLLEQANEIIKNPKFKQPNYIKINLHSVNNHKDCNVLMRNKLHI